MDFRDQKLIDCLIDHHVGFYKRFFRRKIGEIKKEYQIVEWDDGFILFKKENGILIFEPYRGSKSWLKKWPEIINVVNEIAKKNKCEYIVIKSTRKRFFLDLGFDLLKSDGFVNEFIRGV